MNSIITSTPIKAPLDKSKWIPDQTYTYKNHPWPSICCLNANNVPEMRCTECYQITSGKNACKCLQQEYLIHKDRMKNSEILSRRTKDTDYNNNICQQTKGCSRAEFRTHLNVGEIGYGKGIMNCDHIISPKGYNKKGAYDFDMTLKQHRDFICHYKNTQLLTPHENSVKSSHNDPVEVKIVHDEFAKQTPTGDIHDILIAMRERRDVTEIAHIAEVVAVKKEVEEETVDVVRFEFEGKAYWISDKTGLVQTRLIFDKVTHEEIGEWNATSKSIDFYETDDEEEEETDEEEEVDEEEAELVREEAEIAKAKADFAIQMDKREAELKAKKARKEIKNKLPELREALIAKSQAVIDKELKKIADIKSGLFDEQLISNEL